MKEQDFGLALLFFRAKNAAILRINYRPIRFLIFQNFT